MTKLGAALATPFPLSWFCKDRFGVKSIVKRLQRRQDFSGCYVVLGEGAPSYVGVSRGVIQRLRQHVKGKTHFDASLAYLMATGKTGHTMKRAEPMKADDLLKAFTAAQALLRNCFVAFIAIDNPVEL